MGRGSNNKNGTSGQGASNQSNQAFIADGKDQPKSNHHKNNEVTGGEPSEEQPQSEVQSSNRDHSTDGQEEKYN